MASTYTTRIRLEKQGDGENANSWGLRLNQNVIDLVDEAVAGYKTIDVTGATSISLTTGNGTDDEARNFGLNFVGTLTADCTVNIPAVEKIYFVNNKTTSENRQNFGKLSKSMQNYANFSCGRYRPYRFQF